MVVGFQVRNSVKGFTLIEVLVALAVFSSVLAVLTFGLDQGRLQWSRSMAHSSQTAELAKRQAWLERMFAQSNAGNFSVNYGVAASFFVGTSRALNMVTDAPVIGGAGTYSTIALEIIGDEQGSSLVFKQWVNKDPYYGLTSFSDENNTIVLIDSIRNARFSYFLPKRTEASVREAKLGTFRRRLEAVWADEYDAEDEKFPPSKVAIEFEYQEQAYKWIFNLSNSPVSGDIKGNIQLR